MRLLAAWLICLLGAAPAAADSPDVMSVIAGRFDRFEPAFFEARHDRIRQQLNDLPNPPLDDAQRRAVLEALSLFDEAAAALRRAGRFDDAIYLLDQKFLRIQQVRETSGVVARREEARMLSAKAAALLARFREAGAATDLQQARKMLEQALQIDRYDIAAQYALDEVRSLQEPPEWQPKMFPFPNLLGFSDYDMSLPRGPETLARTEHPGAIEYLAGRIVEDGWHDVDAFYALSLALWLNGRDEEAITAWLRVSELIADGETTAVRNAPTGLARLMAEHIGEIPDAKRQQDLYRELRHHADNWVAARNEYAAAQLAQGRHPDTHADFWSGFRKPEPPVANNAQESEPEPPMATVFVFGGAAALAFLLVVLAGFTYYVSRRHPKAPTVDEV